LVEQAIHLLLLLHKEIMGELDRLILHQLIIMVAVAVELLL
tara:strand:+ start:170 stop:292 length:123 start_codon:yes stop_codon:yes gene_type:complete